MKIHTLRGQFIEGQVKRLIVDDGRLTHAMKVTKFIATADVGTSGNDTQAVLGYNDDLPAAWDWGDNRQIAWCSTRIADVSGAQPSFSLIDPNHLIIRDLYIAGVVGTSGGNSVINYYVEMEAVDISEDQSIMALIKERSQNDLRQ